MLDRWTKNVKAAIHDERGFTWDSLVNCQYGSLTECCKQLCAVAAHKTERFRETREFVLGLFETYMAEDEAENQLANERAVRNEDGPRNPRTCRTKGRSGQSSRQKPQRCSVCRIEGHNKTSCPMRNVSNGREVEEETYSEDLYSEMVSN